MAINRTPAIMTVKRQVFELKKVGVNQRPTLNIDESGAYEITVATTLEGKDNYKTKANGFCKLFGKGPTATKAISVLSAARAIIKIATGQAGYSLNPVHDGISPEKVEEINAARAAYNTDVDGQRKMINNFGRDATYMIPLETSQTQEEVNKARSGLEGMTRQ